MSQYYHLQVLTNFFLVILHIAITDMILSLVGRFDASAPNESFAEKCQKENNWDDMINDTNPINDLNETLFPSLEKDCTQRSMTYLLHILLLIY